MVGIDLLSVDCKADLMPGHVIPGRADKTDKMTKFWATETASDWTDQTREPFNLYEVSYYLIRIRIT